MQKLNKTRFTCPRLPRVTGTYTLSRTITKGPYREQFPQTKDNTANESNETKIILFYCEYYNFVNFECTTACGVIRHQTDKQSGTSSIACLLGQLDQQSKTYSSHSECSFHSLHLCIYSSYEWPSKAMSCKQQGIVHRKKMTLLYRVQLYK